MNTCIASRRFGDLDQDRFAEASGDFNPMHMDSIAARRTQAGAPVVHGIHAALWALDALAEAGRIRRPVASLDAIFRKFIYVGDEVTLQVARDTDTSLRVELMAAGMVTTTLTVRYDGEPDATTISCEAPAVIESSEPLALELDAMPNRCGKMPARAGAQSAQMFRHAAEHVGAGRVEAIAQLSNLVGMIIPGLHSIFGSTAIYIVGDDDRAGGITFDVRSVDERFRSVELSAAGSGIVATVTAFVRQPPVVQLSLSEISQVVSKAEFAGTTALVVGGSRGLGALTAKAIVAGGGRAVITYNVGEAEAREIAAELGRDSCRIMRYDARDEALPQLADLEWTIDQLYYFATSHISRQKSSWYSQERFSEFCQFYVHGFETLCAALKTMSAANLTAFYPSSVFVEERPREMTEYGMAKAAGEVLCADMNRFLRGIHVIVRRLPRLRTDQTATVMPTDYGDPLEAMLPILREMQAAGRRES
jgi:acyl dehydratase/NAD(P)-dependent dehydrogenase (short-subunit alcohol dehydrogenase family)